MATQIARGAVYYIAAVNVGSAALFGYDKFQATRGGWRIPERRLCQSALAGGWLGGLMAMQLLRHKTRKTSFQEKYVGAVVTNALIGGCALAVAMRSSRFQNEFRGSVRGLLSGGGGGKRARRHK